MGADRFRLPPNMCGSIAKELDAGRKLELDGVAGPVLRGVKRRAIPTPMTANLVAMTKDME